MVMSVAFAANPITGIFFCCGMCSQASALPELAGPRTALTRSLSIRSIMFWMDLGSPPKSIQNMIDLIDNERVSAVLGPANSGNALAWLHIPQQKKIPVMGFAATATEITTRYAKEPQNYMFRISMVDRDQQSLLAAYAVKASKSRIGMMADTTGYGQGVA